MGEALGGLKRTMMCGEPREANIGSKITLMGWVQRNRKLGGLEFIDLRDRTGIMQIVFGEEINAESFEKAKAVRPEYCIAVTGEVVLREAPNTAMETGMVELKCESIKVLSESETPPIYIKEGLDAAENIRLKYRYLDLRRPDMHRIFAIRSKTTKVIRDYLEENKIEILDVHDFENIAGLGVFGKIENEEILLGNSKILDKYNISNKYLDDEKKLAEKGNSILYVAKNKEVIALIGVNDIVREEAKEVIQKLSKQKIDSIMLTRRQQRNSTKNCQ